MTARSTPGARAESGPGFEGSGQGSSSPSDPAASTLASRLDLLFRTVHPAGQSEVSYQDVVDALAQNGQSVTTAYLSMLRTGKRDNPKIELLTALARYFRVPVSYLVDPDDTDNFGETLRLMAALRDQGVQRLALRSHGLSVGSREAVAAMIEQLRRAEGLPEPPDEQE
jgi:transcriptional regulator with XRE-family HTH domain